MLTSAHAAHRAKKSHHVQHASANLPWDLQSPVGCLATTIYHEARGESNQARTEVGRVVLKRVHHPAFPKTVCGVVKQKTVVHHHVYCQFSWYCHMSKHPVLDKKKWRTSFDSARTALATGPSRALYFNSSGSCPVAARSYREGSLTFCVPKTR